LESSTREKRAEESDCENTGVFAVEQMPANKITLMKNLMRLIRK
jgi:hypothetical protein